MVLMAHCDERALELIFQHRPDSKLIWAHSGFTVPPGELERALERHPTLLLELSYRNDVTASGRLTPAWRRLLLRFPDRFLIGSDTWTSERWTRYEEIMAWYRSWLAQLPAEVADALAWRNAETRFGR
jgi:predicted TIM-barrel fold metal-dependent hydrolase